MKVKNTGLIAIHISVFLLGGSGLFGKLLALNPMIIVLGRAFFATLFLGAIILYQKKTIALKEKKDHFFLVLAGIILAIHWATFFQSIQVSTVAVGLLSFSTFPIFTTFFEPIFCKEKLKMSDVILAIITFIGIAIIIPNFQLADNTTQGALWGMLSGLCFALLAIFNRKYTKSYPSVIISFYQNSWATFFLLPFLFLLDPVFQLNDILLLILLGVVFTAIAHTLFVESLSTVKAQKVSIIANLEPVYTIIFAIFLLHEIPTIRTAIGGIIILGTSLYATMKSTTIVKND